MGACACGAYAFGNYVCKYIKEHSQILRCCRFASAKLVSILYSWKEKSYNPKGLKPFETL